MSNKDLNIKQRIAHASTRWMYCAVAAVFLFGVMLVVLPGRANAYNQVTGRSIEMSSSADGATNVAYKVGFTTVTANQTVGSVVVEVCGNSPIIGDTCTAPSNFNFNASTTTVNNISGNITGLTVDTTDSIANRIVLVPASAPQTGVAVGAVSFTLGNGTTNGITNPILSGATFYARIMTFTNTTGDAGTPADENNNATDAGGVALSTAQQLHVTAKVQEAILFCVYTGDISLGATCATGGNSVSLGDENGVLASNSTVYTNTANFDIASNAVAGVSVRMQGNTLKSGANFTIDPFGAACTADSSTTSVEQFGLRMQILGAGTSASTPYDCLVNNHTFDANTSTGIPSTFGQEIAHTSGATDVSSSVIEFAAKSANTSEAGVYTTTLTLIATATY